jgi:hypothetical protein
MIALPIVDAVLNLGNSLIDRLWPDPSERDKAKLELARLAQEGELKALEVQMSAILAEAHSADKWTSRARPAFLYVCYVLLLASLPMGVVAAISPGTALEIVSGFRMWLAAIPESIITLMEVVCLGYTGARTVEKIKGVSK